MIHPTAIISSQIPATVSIGPYAILDSDVVIGDSCEISSHVRIDRYSEIKKDCRVFQGAVIGSIPQDLKYNGEISSVVIGERTTVREYATIHRGTGIGGKTIIGDDCLIMAYAHIAHDCVIGNSVVLSNSVNLAGHVTIDDFVVIGGLVPVHQFVRIGKHAYIGGGYRIAQDVPPFVLAAGEPLKFAGLNYVGLRRNGFSEERIKLIDKAYFIFYRSSLSRQDALRKITDECPQTEDIRAILGFIEKSERGLIRGA